MKDQPQRRYVAIGSMSEEELRGAMTSGDTAAISNAVLSESLHSDDVTLAVQYCLAALNSPHAAVIRAGVIGLTHVARRHRTFGGARVLPLLESLKANDEFTSLVEDAIEDIDIFIQGSDR